MPGWRWYITDLKCPRCRKRLKSKPGYYKLLCGNCNEYFDPYDKRLKKIK